MQSCIRDHAMSDEEKTLEIAKFEMFARNRQLQKSNKGGSDTSYSTAFRDLYKRYYELHPDESPDFDNPNLTVPDFGYASQVFSDSANHTVLFPMMKNGIVVDILTATINSDEDYLQFYKSERTEYINSAILSFSQKKNAKNSISGKGRDTDEMGTGDIEEVIIPPPPKPVEWPPKRTTECDDLSDYQNGGCGGPPPSPCAAYQNCGDNGAGGNTEPPAKPSPCKVIKKVGKHADTKNLMAQLKRKSQQIDSNNKYKETGYTLTENNGNIDPQEFEGVPGSNEIKLSITNAIDGYIHNHNAGTQAFSVFSAADLATLSLMYSGGKVKDVNSFVFGLVTAKGTQYMITIDDPAAFSNFTNNFLTNGVIDNDKIDSFDEEYANSGINYGSNLIGNEAGFLYLLNKFNSGLKVLKGDHTFTNWQQIERGYNDQVVSTPCN
ncbi:hypothetical protein EG340_07445 [Chryseobacterium indoltheticum]|uniref:Uncharacterized protein n=2 Tax=Chryseobacterium indoltheticum TaxID=254 RepID=A0A3G6N4L4_9FLAO|nr:hypothetical protein EG340_07445 [Chryseobacterium indoltheticum]